MTTILLSTERFIRGIKRVERTIEKQRRLGRMDMGHRKHRRHGIGTTRGTEGMYKTDRPPLPLGKKQNREYMGLGYASNKSWPILDVFSITIEPK